MSPLDTDNLLAAVEDAVDRALRDGAEGVAETARTSILGGAPAGSVTVRDGRAHVASAPGQPPASDSGALAASIAVEASADGYDIVASAPYAATLELGGVHILPRPFLRPALDAHRDAIREAVIEAARNAVETST